MAQLKVSRPTPQRANRRSTVSPLLWELAQGDPSVALKTMVSRIRTNDLPVAMGGTFSGRDGPQEVPIAELVPGVRKWLSFR